MTGSGAVDRYNIDRASRPRFISRLVNPHRLGKFRPSRSVDKSVVMPITQVTHGGGRSRTGRIHGGFLTEMLNHGVIPRITLLMAENQGVSWHRVLRIGGL